MERWADPLRDAPALAQVFYNAIRRGPSPYTDAQRAAWLPAVPDTEAFAQRLAAQSVALSERDGSPIGFMTLAADGYVDLAYILHAERGAGVFGRLFQMIEQRAHGQGNERLWTHASLLAQPAFRKHGFSIIQHETVTRSGEVLARAEMEKALR